MYEVILWGILLGIIFYELTDISPGGIIVPGVLVLYFNQLDRIIFSIILAILTNLIIKALSNYLIIFGKRKYALTLITAIFLAFMTDKILLELSLPFTLTEIGYIIPGIIANDFNRQGIVKTSLAMGIVVILLRLLLLLTV